MQLRPYQRRAIDALYQWVSTHSGDPVLVLPTGAGKSVIIAALCREAIEAQPECRVLMLTHVRELIEQNAARLRAVWPNAPLGVYSAGLSSRTVDAVTYAGIQSVCRRPEVLGRVDLCVIDECHLVSPDAESSYRATLAALRSVNPEMRVVGLTATPYRLGQGLLTDGENPLFSGILEPVTIEELIHLGHLAPLRSKLTGTVYDTGGVTRRGGEFVESELAARVNTSDLNLQVAGEIKAWGELNERKSWLLFCSGVAHAEAMAEAMIAHGVRTYCVTGETPAATRDAILSGFRDGNVRCVTNANVLTTGFDHPALDLIAMLRPTMSPGLYVQMAGRGLRTAEGKADCLVLDFAGNVATHGPITAVIPPQVGRAGKGEAPAKACPHCAELVHLSCMVCPHCGHEWEREEPGEKVKTRRDDDIMAAQGPQVLEVSEWLVKLHAPAGKIPSIRIDYYSEMGGSVSEWLCVDHGGFAGSKGRSLADEICRRVGVERCQEIESQVEALQAGKPPRAVRWERDGKHKRVTGRAW